MFWFLKKLRVPMGLRQSSNVFQLLIDKILHGLNFLTVFCYLDDDCIWLSSFQKYSSDIQPTARNNNVPWACLTSFGNTSWCSVQQIGLFKTFWRKELTLSGQTLVGIILLSKKTLNHNQRLKLFRVVTNSFI